MQYVVCDTKLRPMSHFCAHDHVEILEGYTRDLETGVLYHNPWCLQQHKFACTEALTHHVA